MKVTKMYTLKIERTDLVGLCSFLKKQMISSLFAILLELRYPMQS
jgi:hypothetical protein